MWITLLSTAFSDQIISTEIRVFVTTHSSLHLCVGNFQKAPSDFQCMTE